MGPGCWQALPCWPSGAGRRMRSSWRCSPWQPRPEVRKAWRSRSSCSRNQQLWRRSRCLSCAIPFPCIMRNARRASLFPANHLYGQMLHQREHPCRKAQAGAQPRGRREKQLPRSREHRQKCHLLFTCAGYSTGKPGGSQSLRPARKVRPLRRGSRLPAGRCRKSSGRVCCCSGIRGNSISVCFIPLVIPIKVKELERKV